MKEGEGYLGPQPPHQNHKTSDSFCLSLFLLGFFLMRTAYIGAEGRDPA